MFHHTQTLKPDKRFYKTCLGDKLPGIYYTNISNPPTECYEVFWRQWKNFYDYSPDKYRVDYAKHR